jgi:ABC-2 type transport system ATP-binding protein
VIVFNKLRKLYGDFCALDGLDCTIPKGATVGLIGPNGAGKTTSMRLLTTLITPTSGDVLVDGVSVTTQPHLVRRMIGYMPDTFGVYEAMTATEYLDFYARCYHIPVATRHALINDLLGLVDLASKRDALVMSLSRGMAQRLSLARALLHDPAVLVLDEPASGLDPRARIELRALLHELHDQGKTILISSHILSDLADLCTHLIILEQGKLVAYDTLTALLSAQQSRRIVIQTLAPSPALYTLVTHFNYIISVDPQLPTRYIVQMTGDDAAQAELLKACITHDIPVQQFASEANTLERTFLQVTAGLN